MKQRVIVISEQLLLCRKYLSRVPAVCSWSRHIFLNNLNFACVSGNFIYLLPMLSKAVVKKEAHLYIRRDTESKCIFVIN